MEDLTIIIPAYNEEAAISDTVRQCAQACPGAKIMVVDDCSKDKTNETLHSLKEEFPQLLIIRNETNQNYGGALKVGYAQFDTKYAAFLDADATYPPRYLPRLLQTIKERDVDFVLTNRFGTNLNQMPLLRKIGNKMLVAMFLVRSARYLPDVCSGMRLFTRDAIDKVDYKTLPRGLDMITALSRRTVARKLRYTVIPIEYPKREGASKLNVVKDFLRMTRNIIFEK